MSATTIIDTAPLGALIRYTDGSCRVVLKSETARAGGYSLPLNVRFCFRKQRASQVSFHYLINCGKQTWLLSIGAQ